MKIVTFVTNKQDILECASAQLVSEVLIEPRMLARLGRLDWECAVELARYANEHGLRAVLVWDILMTESILQEVLGFLRTRSLEDFSAVRIVDLGAAHWVKTATDINLQLILEAGSHNLTALQGWAEYFGQRLERVVVSHELPEASLRLMCLNSDVPVEILGAGRIELFYSPRPLLSSNFTPAADGLIEVTSASEESHNRPFPTIESQHGTMMFLHRDRFVLQRWEILKELGLSKLRVDLRHLSSDGRAAAGIATIADQLLAGEPVHWPVASGQPFKHSNNTTRQFVRLRSKLAGQRGLDSCLAEVIASESSRFTVYKAVRASVVKGPLRFHLPTGEELRLEKLSFKDLEDCPLEHFEEDQIFVSPWVRKAGPGTLLFLEER